MMELRSYRMFFFSALFLHGMLVILLMWDSSSNERPAMTLEARNTLAAPSAQSPTPEPQAIQAVSVDSKDVAAAVHALKAERDRTAAVEKNRQLALAAQADAARRKRVQEQQRLEQLKAESAKMAIAQKKKMAEEQQHLKALATQKENEKKKLEAIQQQQKDEEKSLADLRTKKTEEQKLQTEASAARAAEALAMQQQKLKQEQAAAQEQAAHDAADKTRVAGVVDKYKAVDFT